MVGDAHAIFNLGFEYSEGTNGFPRDDGKALELWHRAAELGYTKAYSNTLVMFTLVAKV